MRRKFSVAVAIVSILIGLCLQVPQGYGADEPPPEGGALPELKLPVPKRSVDRQYLGIKDSAFFRIPQAKAEVLIIEVFSMYCPFCQREAPVVNELYDLIERRPELKDKIKIIGIGAGNSAFEVNAFKNLYAIPFPLFPDNDLSAHNILGQVRTPYFIGVKLHPNGSTKVIYSRVGSFGDPKQFLDLILSKAGL